MTSVNESAVEDYQPASPVFQGWGEDHPVLTPMSKVSTGGSSSGSFRDTPATSFSDSDLLRGSPLQPAGQTAPTSVTNTPSFDELLERGRVSPHMAERFKALRNMVYAINVRVFLTDSRQPAADFDEAKTLTSSMAQWLFVFCEAIKDRVKNIAFITGLAPFTIHPPRTALWLLYKQRAELIVRYTYLPQPSDLQLLQQFIRLFEDFIYIGILQLSSEMKEELHDAFFDIYATLLESEQEYMAWLQGMKELREVYMIPVMKAILDEEANQQAILRQTDDDNAALLFADKAAGTLMRFPSKATNLCLGRTAEMVKQSRRFRRQYTL